MREGGERQFRRAQVHPWSLGAGVRRWRADCTRTATVNVALEGQSGLKVSEPGLVRRVLTFLASSVVFGLAATRFLRVFATTINSDSLYLAGLYRDIFIDK